MAVQRRKIRGKEYYVARWREHDGRERSKSFSIDVLGARRAKADASAFEAEQLDKLGKGTYISPDKGKVTVWALVEAWQAQASNAGTRRVRGHLLDNLGDLAGIRIDTLTAPHVRRWVGMLADGRPWAEGKPVASNTVAGLLGQLKGALNQAVDDGLISVNPARRVSAPVVGRRVSLVDIPTPEDVRALVELGRVGCAAAVRDGRRVLAVTGSVDLSAAVRVMAVTGMRPAEVAALTWTAVDLDKASILVSVQVDRRDACRLVPLKTGDSGVRTVSVDSETIEVLRGLYAADSVRDGRVFHIKGRPLSPNYLSNVFPRMVRHLGLPSTIRAKSLRHFHATQLLAAGVSIKTVQYRMGHATATHTLDTYGHFMPQDDVRAADVIGGVFAGTMRENPRRFGVV